jgi:low affinity Fe/Cu permease
MVHGAKPVTVWEENPMTKRITRRVSERLESFAHQVTAWAGSSWAFGLAVGILVIWALTGPLFGFSDTWQLVINTGTTIVTFLMVFLIQRFQNKDALAIHLKLNELVAALEGASNRLINVEDLTEAEVQTLHRHYRLLAAIAKREDVLTHSHSIEEAERRHAIKKHHERTKADAVPHVSHGDQGGA